MATFGSSSSSSSRDINVVKGPSPHVKAWESGARMVKNISVENQYLEHIREVHDPSQHIKTIEDELKATIGKALGKQGEKILMYARLMDQERRRYDELMKQHAGHVQHADIQKSVREHNNYRKECLNARWELIVHRQAVGFIVNNHQYVTSMFPVGDALPECEEGQGRQQEDENGTSGPKSTAPAKSFGDQLDWWQRIGRWK